MISMKIWIFISLTALFNFWLGFLICAIFGINKKGDN